MENKTFKKYYLFCLLGVLTASFYPIYMGASVLCDMIRYGSVSAENYPKYIIPYTPISIALIVAVVLMPLIMKYTKKSALLVASLFSGLVFFASELMFESMVIVKRTFTWSGSFGDYYSKLEDWQMYMCATTPLDGKLTETHILMGEYSPTFKLHFYMISIVLIISVLNCMYGFAHMIVSGDTRRRKPLIIQSTAGVAFLGMCIWACFTAFYRTGTIQISALSAVLMSLFFVLLGMTVGVYVASFTLGKQKLYSVVLPGIIASVTTLAMYIGEMCLLSGHLYRFGRGFLFDGLGILVFAPIDILIILLAGALTAWIATLIGKAPNTAPASA